MALRIGLSLVGGMFFFLAGLTAGAWLALRGLAAVELPAILALPEAYYPVAAGMALGMALLLRKAAAAV